MLLVNRSIFYIIVIYVKQHHSVLAIVTIKMIDNTYVFVSYLSYFQKELSYFSLFHIRFFFLKKNSDFKWKCIWSMISPFFHSPFLIFVEWLRGYNKLKVIFGLEYIKLNTHLGAEEMAQLLRVLAIIPKDVRLVPTTLVRWCTSAYI